MARKEAALTAIGLTQQFDGNYWGALTDTEAAALETARKDGGSIKPLTNCIITRLTAAGFCVAECHGIKHDADIHMVWSEAERREIPAYKTNHGHWVIKFAQGKGGTLDALAAAIGVEPQYVERPAKGRYAYDNMLSYLCHVKYPDKHQYNTDEVYTAIGTPYSHYVKERWVAWEKARGAVVKKRACEGIDDLEYKILTGQVTKSQIILTDELFEIYSRNRRRCEEALETYGERRAYKTLKALADGDFSMSVFFITGPAGVGKTHFTAKLVDNVIAESVKRFGDDARWRVCHSAATNPVDDYRGEEILVMDDVRGFSMTGSDWLKLLDPHYASPNSARYHNKTVACRTIIITSTKEPLEFFYYTRSVAGGRDCSEGMDQFLRRLAALVHVIPYREFDPRYAIETSVHDDTPHAEPLPWLSSTYGTPTVSLHTRFASQGEPDEVYDGATAMRLLTDQVMAAHGYDTLYERRAEQLAEHGITLQRPPKT